MFYIFIFRPRHVRKLSRYIHASRFKGYCRHLHFYLHCTLGGLLVLLSVKSYSNYKVGWKIFQTDPLSTFWSPTPFYRGAVYSCFWFVFILCFPLVRKNEQSEILQRCLVSSMIKNQPTSQNHEKIEVQFHGNERSGLKYLWPAHERRVKNMPPPA